MRLVFAGTPAAAVPSLRTLAASRHEIALVVSRTDAPLGRKRVLTPSPVTQAARELDLDVFTTDRLDAAATARITEVEPELGVIVAYGGLVREPLLSAPTHGWINLHFSLLPRWRGAAPVQRALIAGDSQTGASVFRLVAELDAGDVFDERVLTIPPDADAGALLETLAEEGAALLSDVVDRIADGTAQGVPQSGEPTLAPKLTDADGLIDWHAPHERVLAHIRGVTPEPGARTTIGGARFKVLRAADPGIEHAPLAPGSFAFADGRVLVGTSSAPVELVTVQPAGKNAMRATDWWRGLRGETPVAGS